MPHRRSSLCEPPPPQEVQIIYDDSKAYWKARTNLDIVIALHKKCACLEVVVYNPELDREAPRLYLNALVVNQHLNRAELDKRVNEKKEVFIRSKKSFNAMDITKEVLDEMMQNYVLSRLQVEMLNKPLPLPGTASTTAANSQILIKNNNSSDKSASSEDGAAVTPFSPREFVMNLFPHLGDSVDAEGCLDSFMDKPAELVPIKCSFQKKLKAEAVQVALTTFNNEAQALRDATHYAELSSSSADGFKLALAEKLRMKRLMSLPRQRWLKAIQRVIAQNSVEKVRRRLESMIAAKKVVEPQVEEPITSFRRSSHTRILRKSIDNSSLPSLSPKPHHNGAVSPSHAMHHLPTLNSSEDESQLTKFPGVVLPSINTGVHVHDGHNSAKQTPTGGLLAASIRQSRRILERRSFHMGDEASHRSSSKATFNRYASPDGSTNATSPASSKVNDSLQNSISVPSLRQSFAEISGRISGPTVTIISKPVSTRRRSMRLHEH